MALINEERLSVSGRDSDDRLPQLLRCTFGDGVDSVDEITEA